MRTPSASTRAAATAAITLAAAVAHGCGGAVAPATVGEGIATAAEASIVPSPVVGALRPVIASAGAVEREPAPAVEHAPMDLREFVARYRAGDALAASFVRADFERVFATKRGGLDHPGTNHAFADLDGDGADEAIAAIGDGWWGGRLDVAVFAPQADGFVLASRWRHEGGVRGTPALRVVGAGRRRWITVAWGSDWGAGVQRGSSAVLEWVAGRLVATLSYVSSAEEVYAGEDPVIEWRIGDLALQPASDGAGTIATAALRGSFVAGDFPGGDGEVALALPLRWTQAQPGAAFEPHAETAACLDPEAIWRRAARAWIAAHATTARVYVRGTTAQQVSIRRTCELALAAGPLPAATELLALLPPAPR